jgi:hypothetical protein
MANAFDRSDDANDADAGSRANGAKDAMELGRRRQRRRKTMEQKGGQ